MEASLPENAAIKSCEDIIDLKNSISCSELTKTVDLPSPITNETTTEAPILPNESPEVFIPDDNIIHTQGSIDLEGDEKHTDKEIPDGQVIPEVKKKKKVIQQGQERRRSERLMKDSSLTTMEKVGMVAKKRNLEGNQTNSNSFSVLSIDEVVHISSEMGIVIDDSAFDTCNLLKDLETARNDLYQKQFEQKKGP